MNFKRAHELGCEDRDAYWHWSEMEGSNEEWKASADAAKLGLAKFGNDQGLMFRCGYAIHRQGKELILEDDSPDGIKLCRQAHETLTRALSLRTSEDRNYLLRNQIHRAIVLNLEALDDGALLARHYVDWEKDCPNDGYLASDLQRLRQKYPQYLKAH